MRNKNRNLSGRTIDRSTCERNEGIRSLSNLITRKLKRNWNRDLLELWENMYKIIFTLLHRSTSFELYAIKRLTLCTLQCVCFNICYLMIYWTNRAYRLSLFLFKKLTDTGFVFVITVVYARYLRNWTQLNDTPTHNIGFGYYIIFVDKYFICNDRRSLWQFYTNAWS